MRGLEQSMRWGGVAGGKARGIRGGWADGGGVLDNVKILAFTWSEMRH